MDLESLEALRKQAEEKGLPTHCYSELPSTKEPILIRFGENGYYPVQLPEGVTVDSLNRMLGISQAQRMAMEAGSMFGWDVPGADPKCYEKGEEKSMKIKIYQIDLDRDKNNLAFQGLDTLERWQGTEKIDGSIYDLAFDGEVKAGSLERVYEIFNTDERPKDYRGRSLSVSDVVEVVESPIVEKGCYFCDSVGFQKVDFTMGSPVVDNSGMIRALVVEPEKKPYEKMIRTDLKSLQREVDGYVETVYPYEEEVAIVLNEEGKLDGLPLNRALRDEQGNMYDAIAGKFLVVGLGDEDFCSLSDKDMEKFSKLFEKPELFVQINGKLTVIPIEDEPKTPNKDDKGER